MDEELEKQFIDGTRLIAAQRPQKVWYSYEVLHLIEIIQRQQDEIEKLKNPPNEYY